MANLKNTTIDDTGFLQVPRGTTGERPNSPELGMMRYNTDEEYLEFYNGEEWIDASVPTIDLPFTVGFEEGTFIPQWTQTTNFNIVSSPTNTGNFAAGTSGGNIDAVLDIQGLFGEALQFSQLEFYWWERSAQSGFTVNFEDSSGNPVFDCGGNNPQWEINDASGNTQVGRTNAAYETWVLYRFTFDWPNSQYTYFYQETTDTGNTESGTRTLFRNTDIATMKINDSIWGSAASMYFDDIKFS